MRYRELIEKAKVRELYHVSADPNLTIRPDHDLMQGQLGRGFYITEDPRVWADTLERKFLYRVANPSALKIATRKPSLHEFTDWAISRGFMEMAPVVKPDGTPVYELDDRTPLVRPRVTKIGEKFLWRDPMTGQTMLDLHNEQLKDQGFNAYDPEYSREGHQIIVFDPSILVLKKVRWASLR